LRIEKGYGPAVITTITSSFYYWLWLVVSDCYHVTKGDIAVIPISKTAKEDKCLKLLSEQLLKSLWKNAEKRVRNRNDGTSQVEINFKVGLSKPIIDEIDTILASHYGFTEEELDFIINYDIKYRMGRGGGEEEA
ncbi:MAG TPA: SAM-dependent methyltransferase, partial [Verrucomicrobiales bacterium]|nr:SAM-dependent methyltransferase [Verrucomicrobiales bacterium]